MKQVIFIAAAFAFTAIGCNSNSAPKEEIANDVALAEHVDPICNMVKDDTWTDFTVYNNDTTWFCSIPCKDAFDKNPEKYLGNK